MDKTQEGAQSKTFRTVRRSGIKARPQNPDATRDPEKLLQELLIHQVELRMQNEELRRTQENLQESQARYVDLFELAPVGYLILGEDGKILEANLTATHLLGLEKGQLRNRRLSGFVEPEFQDALYFHLKRVGKGGIQEPCELKLRTAKGDSFFFHLQSVAIPQGPNAPMQIRSSLINIHEKKLQDNRLRESAERNELLLSLLPHPAILIDKDRKVLAANRMARSNGAEIGGYWTLDFQESRKPDRTPAAKPRGISYQGDEGPGKQRLVTIIEDSNDAISILDLQGNIKAWNRRAEKIFGYSAAEALKMSVFDLVPPNRRQETRNLLSDIRSGVLVRPFETRRVAKDGCVLDICLTITRLVQGGKIVAIATTERDITDHNRWLASIQELPRRILVAREKERSRISQVIHSDFGQSLIALKMFTAMSASALPGDHPQMQPVFKKIKTHLDQIIKKARDLSHELAPPSLKYVGLVASLQKLVESTRFQKDLKIRFFHRNMDGICFRTKDIIIYRIVQETLQNIYKHAKATRARVKAMVQGSVFTLEINDNGRGFDPSARTTTMGLGLTLMREQVHLLHGTLSIVSQGGKGTSIKITVPVKEKKKP